MVSWCPCELALNDRIVLFQDAVSLAVDTLAKSHSRSSSISSEHDFGCKTVSPETNFEIDFQKIVAGLDLRTTCMIRNIPNKYTQVPTLLPLPWTPSHSLSCPANAH